MCLYLDLEATKQWKRDHKGQGYVWAIKQFFPERSSARLNSIAQSEWITQPGRVVSNREQPRLNGDEKNSCTVNRGNHVFLNCRLPLKNAVALKVRCRVKDFVAVGEMRYSGGHYPSAVFMAYEIPKSEWVRVFGALPGKRREGK